MVGPDPHANAGEIRRSMAAAASAGARLVQFPEGALSGYVKAQIPAWGSVDWDAQRAALATVQAEAARLGLWAVVGCNHPLTPPHRPHNSLYVVSPTGRIATRYDKRHCSHTEVSDWYSPGAEPIVVTIEGFRFGLALCIEIQFPELFLDYERRGADAVLFSSYSRDPMFAIQARALAATTTLWIAMAVPAQCSDAAPSAIFAPNGDVVARCADDGRADLACATLDRSDPALAVALGKARPWRGEARAGAIYRERIVEDPRSSDRRTP
ncbi:MAG: carbon-nitrogen hydrolase family protein [Alphaproteobacteria bacterium]|nr:carbon-nitrogen hydrolase family protein [Alphaproteobacteria bacterium]